MHAWLLSRSLALARALRHNGRVVTRSEAQKKAADLAEKLSRYQRAYYVDAKPLVSDRDYDRLFDELVALEKEFPDLAAEDSPTRRVGSDLTQDLPEVAHTIPVLSLDKAYEVAELLAWAAKTARNAGNALSLVCEEKIDGASIVLYYEGGLLARAVTRGNGLVGNDVTGNVRTIGSVPLRLSRPVTVAVRGEIFLAKSMFSRVNATMEEPYANPRNLAAGTLRRVKSSEAAAVPLEIFVYEGFFESARPSHRAVLEELAELGFRLNPRVGFFSDTVPVEEVRGGAPRLDSRAGSPTSGCSSRRRPRHARGWTTTSTGSSSRWTRSRPARRWDTRATIPGGPSRSSSNPPRGRRP